MDEVTTPGEITTVGGETSAKNPPSLEKKVAQGPITAKLLSVHQEPDYPTLEAALVQETVSGICYAGWLEGNPLPSIGNIYTISAGGEHPVAVLA